MKILLYAFGPYDRFSENITETILRQMPTMPGVTKKVFKVTFDREMFETEFRRVKPDIIVGLGQHPRARKIRIERKARNEWSTRAMKRSKKIESGKSDKKMSLKLPPSELASITYDAGTYVCNFSMFVAENYGEQTSTKAAFLHVPRSMEVAVGVRYLRNLVSQLAKG